jgi:hypothetical protein
MKKAAFVTVTLRCNEAGPEIWFNQNLVQSNEPAQRRALAGAPRQAAIGDG